MRKYLVVILLLLLCRFAQGELVINELMQSNVDCVLDDLNQYPGSWVEVYYSGTGIINLSNYKIGLTRNSDDAYRLHDYEVAAGRCALIFCDEESTGLHTNFRLESGNHSSVYLFHDNVLIDSVVNLPKMPAPNIAYGRLTDNGSEWGYLSIPTPGESNLGETASSVLGEVEFSVSGQVLTSNSSFQVVLSAPVGTPSGAVIRYTLDGSEPHKQSALYSHPLSVSATTILRAKLFCEGYLSPRARTESYIFLNREMTLPVISIVTDDRHLYNASTGILYRDPEKASDDYSQNYYRNWRRPINFELFDQPQTGSQLNQLCEARVQGGASRGCALKSLAFYAKKRFGNSRFAYEFFPDQRPSETDYKSFVIRNAGNDFDYLYMRDAVIQRSVAQNVDLDWQAWRPAIIFINGEYKGIENIRERANEDNIFTNYQELEDICLMENGWNLKKGTWTEWNEFKAFYEAQGHMWEEWNAVLDVNEYINLMVMNLFFNNQDFPGNNIVYWRSHIRTPEVDTRWRFIAKDTDFGLGLYGSSYDYQTMQWMYNPDYDSNRNWANQWEHTRLFRRAMTNSQFQSAFVDCAAVYMGDFLNFERIWEEVWQPMYNMIKSEYPIHRKLYNEWWPNYNSELNSARQWLVKRPESFYQQLANQYNLGVPTPMQIITDNNVSEDENIRLSFNGIELKHGSWNGQYFRNRAIKLKASLKEDDGRHISGWSITYQRTDGSTTQTIQGDSCSLLIPGTCTRLLVNVLTSSESTAIMEEPNVVERAEKFIENGRLIILKNGLYYDVLGNRTCK